jgi:hydroxyacylglutathione hydrolase
MILKQYYLGCLSHASYLIGDERTGSAVIVDPQRDVDAYIRDAAAQGLEIKDVVLTHFHADFVSGHLELARRTGASISLGAAAQAAYPFVPRHDGDVLQYGDTRLEFRETPGHTPEGVSVVAYEGERVKAVFTGDTLFAGDVGRPDLMASQGHTAEALAGSLYDSIHGRLLTLPDETLVYPAHGPGSLCGSGGSSDTSSTIGKERLENAALQPMPRADFVQRVTSDLPDVPPYFARDAAVNRSVRETLEEALARSLRPMCTDEALLHQNQGAQVLDVRDQDAFFEGHFTNSINCPLDGRFAQWAATLLDPSKPVVVIAPAGRETEAITRLGRVGVDRVLGYVEGDLSARPDLVERGVRVSPEELHAQPQRPMVLDVRTMKEWNAGHIEGAVHIPLTQLPLREAEVPRDRPVVVTCAGGYRSSMAVSLLQQQARGCFTDLAGGMAAWQAAGLPVVLGER